jgi:glycosyltransferase involved in cell wall biosynthesis
MRVGFDMTPAALSPAGTGRYPRELLHALERREDPAVIPIASSLRRPATVPQRAVQGLRREGWWYPVGLARTAREVRADVVHVPAPYSARVRDRPLVLTVHDVLPFHYPELFTRVVVAHSRLAWRAAVLGATRVVTGSQHTRGELIELFGVPEAHVVVTPYGVSRRFHPRDVDPEWLAARFGIDRRFVLCVGTLEPRKNLTTALRAFRLASEGLDDVQLVVAGGRGWRNDSFDAELGDGARDVSVTGFVSDDELAALYSAAECFVYPSLYEGFGLPVLEAMACGAPVVTSDATSLPEVAGDAALLAPPADVEAVAGAIRRVLTEDGLAARLRERGLQRAGDLSWDACAEATTAVYREAVAVHAAG